MVGRNVGISLCMREVDSHGRVEGLGVPQKLNRVSDVLYNGPPRVHFCHEEQPASSLHQVTAEDRLRQSCEDGMNDITAVRGCNKGRVLFRHVSTACRHRIYRPTVS